MKTVLRYLLAAAAFTAAVCSAACSGSDDDPGVPAGTLHISADRTAITAGGPEAVTFRVMYGSSDVSRSERMHLVQEFSGQATELDGGINTFAAPAPGSYTFKARYRDGEKVVESENSVVVTVSAGSGSGNYYRKLLFMQFTSVGCVNCPAMSTSLKAVQEERPGRIAAASFHLQYDPNYPDPMWIKANDMYGQKFDVTGLPTGFLDLRPDVRMSSDKAAIDKAIAAALTENSADCGVALATAYDAGSREVKVEVKVTSDAAETYRYLILLVEDGISYFQLGADEATHTHNNVVRAVLSSNVYGERLNQGNALQPGVEVKASRSTTLGASWNPANMRIIAAALASQDGGVTFTCRNANECALGGNANYQYNE